MDDENDDVVVWGRPLGRVRQRSTPERRLEGAHGRKSVARFSLGTEEHARESQVSFQRSKSKSHSDFVYDGSPARRSRQSSIRDTAPIVEVGGIAFSTTLLDFSLPAMFRVAAFTQSKTIC